MYGARADAAFLGRLATACRHERSKAGHGLFAKVYKITSDWEGKRYSGVSLDWDYNARTVRCSMPGYVKAALEEFNHKRPNQQQHVPSKTTDHRLSGGARLLTKKEITFIQRVTGKFLYYARAAGCAMLRALSGIATKTVNGTTEAMGAINTFMGCAAWHPGAPALLGLLWPWSCAL